MRAIAACLFLLTAACSSVTPQPAQAEFQAASERVMWQVSTLAMERNGFPPSAEQDRAHGRLASGWRVSLQPFKSQGHRERCEVEYEARGGTTFGVSVRVLKETNEELSKPLDPNYAKWEKAADDTEAAGRVLGTIRVLLGTEFKLGPKGPPTELPPQG